MRKAILLNRKMQNRKVANRKVRSVLTGRGIACCDDSENGAVYVYYQAFSNSSSVTSGRMPTRPG